MSKLLRISDKFLIGLSVVGEVFDKFEEIRPSKRKWAESAYGLFPHNYKKENYYTAVSRMLKSEVIERVIVDGEAKLRISAKGKGLLSRDFSFLNLQKNKWDRKWRIVTFDIPVKKTKLRDNLRYKLKELGFGKLQQSIWISPLPIEDDIYEFLESNNLKKQVYVFISEKILGDIEIIVDKIWGIEKINNLYKKAFTENNKDAYYKALSIDPFLPKELLPKNWWGDRPLTKLFAGAN